MKKVQYRQVFAVFFLLIGGFSLLMAWRLYQKPQPQWTTFFSPEKSWTAASYTSLQDTEVQSEKASPFALWNEKEQQTVENAFSKRKKTVTALFVAGDVRVILPITQTLATGDENGCLLDESTGKALFGDALPNDGKIRWNNKEYEVRGFFPSSVPAVVFSPDISDQQPLLYITTTATSSTDFASRHGLDTNQSISGKQFGEKEKLYLYFPAFLLISAFIFLWIKKSSLFPKNLLGFTIRWAVFFLLLFILLSLVLHALPAQWLPAQWANLDFWSETIKKTQSQQTWASSVAKGIPYTIAQKQEHQVLSYCIFSIIAIGIGGYRWRFFCKNSLDGSF